MLSSNALPLIHLNFNPKPIGALQQNQIDCPVLSLFINKSYFNKAHANALFGQQVYFGKDAVDN